MEGVLRSGTRDLSGHHLTINRDALEEAQEQVDGFLQLTLAGKAEVRIFFVSHLAPSFIFNESIPAVAFRIQVNRSLPHLSLFQRQAHSRKSRRALSQRKNLLVDVLPQTVQRR